MRALVLAVLVGLGCNDAAPRPQRNLRVLFFQKEAQDLGWFHASNPVADEALRNFGAPRGWEVTTTKDAGVFTDDGLARFDVVVFLLASGNVLDEPQQQALVRFMARGKGYSGVHSASFVNPDWKYYGELVGAVFHSHPPGILSATMAVSADETTAHLPSTWARNDEIYTFRAQPRSDVKVLLSLDEDSVQPPLGAEFRMGGVHPLAWRHEYGGGRSFYVALGHTVESYSDPQFVELIGRGIEWAGAPSRAAVP